MNSYTRTRGGGLRRWARQRLRVGRCGPVARPLALAASRVNLPGSRLIAFGLLGKPRHGSVEVTVRRDGLEWALDLRDDAHRLMFLDCYERELRRRALALLPSGGRFVDVGANVGFWTVPAAHRVGPTGSVVAIEPNPWAVDRLRRNIDLNSSGLAPVEIVAQAAGDSAGTLELLSYDLEAGASRATVYRGAASTAEVERAEVERVSVAATTLDAVVSGPVDMIKLDAQGHESAIFDGGQTLFEEFPPSYVVIELDAELLRFAGSSPEQMLVRLEGLGYHPVDGDGDLGRALVHRPLPLNFCETVVFVHTGPSDQQPS
jgi:FkbM family methyltransferase